MAQTRVGSLQIKDGDIKTEDIADLAVTDLKVASANKDGSAGTFSMRTLGTEALQAAAGNDPRLSDQRAPLSHTQAESTITFSDITTGDATASAHGFMPKLSGNSSQVFRGDGTWGAAGSGGGFLKQEFTYSASNTFTLSQAYSNILLITVNGRELFSTQYTKPSTTTITVTDTLESGDSIIVTYNFSGEITTPAGGTDIGYTASTTQGSITSSTGTGAIIALVDATNAGLVSSNMKSSWDSKQAALGFTAVPNTLTVNTKPLNANIVLTTSDIADVTNKRYLTDAQQVVVSNTSNTNSGDNSINTLYSGLASSKADVATPTFTTRITVPLILGGTGTTQTVVYQTTSGAGATGADHIFKVGTNGAITAVTIQNDGRVALGHNLVATEKLQVLGNIMCDTGGYFFYNKGTSSNQILLNNSGAGWATIQNDAASTWSLGWTSAYTSTPGTPVLTWTAGGRVSVGVTGTAWMTIKAGTTAAQTAPIKVTSGPLMTAPEIGALEFLTDRLYFTKTTAVNRETIAYLSDITGGSSPLTTKGDLYTFSTVGARFAVGTNGQVLSADSTAATGLKWISAPPASAGGADREIQYNNAGVIEGASKSSISADGNILFDVYEEATKPATPTTGQVTIFGKRKGGRPLAAIIGPSGLDTTLQPFIGSNKIALWSHSGNSALITAPTLFLLNLAHVAANVEGTVTARTVVPGSNLLTTTRRLGYVTTNTSGSSAGVRQILAQWSLGGGGNYGGFFFVCRVGYVTPGTANRGFIGFSSNTGAFTLSADPSATGASSTAICIGIGYDTADTNWQIFTRTATAAVVTKIDSGIPKPVDAKIYEIAIFTPPGGGIAHFSIEDLVTGAKFYTSTSLTLPSATQTLSQRVWLNNGNTTGTPGIDIISMYIETDY
jgi:hypothetical protein